MKRLLILVTLTMAATGCSTPGKLTSTTSATVAKLDEQFRVLARIGDLPHNINDTDNVAHYAIAPKGRSPEYLIIVHPKSVQGDLTLPIKDNPDTIESAFHYNRYIDLLLRAHRQLLRGQVEASKEVLTKIDEQYDITYGSLVLSANLDLLSGDADQAAEKLELAKRLLPGTSQAIPDPNAGSDPKGN